jgi:hypothetical protein
MFKNKRALIIHKQVSFSCFLGAVHGTITGDVSDDGSEVFPVRITAQTNLGSGSFDLKINGNETIDEELQGAKVEVTISQWQCDQETLSFHVKAVAKKAFLSCNILDESFRGSRHNAETLTNVLADLDMKLKSLSAAKSS